MKLAELATLRQQQNDETEQAKADKDRNTEVEHAHTIETIVKPLIIAKLVEEYDLDAGELADVITVHQNGSTRWIYPADTSEMICPSRVSVTICLPHHRTIYARFLGLGHGGQYSEYVHDAFYRPECEGARNFTIDGPKQTTIVFNHLGDALLAAGIQED